jgi:hypothetical protein
MNTGLGLVVKLGSIAVHAEELLDGLKSGAWSPLDIEAIRSLLDDPEVKEFRVEADKLALLPVKR